MFTLKTCTLKLETNAAESLTSFLLTTQIIFVSLCIYIAWDSSSTIGKIWWNGSCLIRWQHPQRWPTGHHNNCFTLKLLVTSRPAYHKRCHQALFPLSSSWWADDETKPDLNRTKKKNNRNQEEPKERKELSWPSFSQQWSEWYWFPQIPWLY